MTLPQGLRELIEKFKQNQDQYSSKDYKEAELRREFIDPLFEILGWDMTNKKGAAEQYKDVKYEPSTEVEGETKAPDYAFRIGGTTKFFMEAKKPFVNIAHNPLPAFQLRRYAWSQEMPLSILINFERIYVYDGRFKPHKSDDPSKARTMRIDIDELENRWDEFSNIFSYDAVLKGSFDRYAMDTKNKKGTSKVNDEFLKEIEAWREAIAKNIALRNPKPGIEELNYSVQKIIDRIIFLRICEDRGTEPPEQLRELIKKAHIYRRLVDLFQLADAKYNSGLFHFEADKKRATHPDEITPKLRIDDEVLEKIIVGLYYPDSPYQFDVIPADILGQVYEQFLGKVIRLTEGHHAKVEEKPEVKKAGGVYYTPAYIVKYIVENTVGVLCKGKTPDEMGKLRILDPACGSGSFLIVAYERMLKEHLDWYVSNEPKKRKDNVFQGQKGEWRLTLKEKKRILLNNIYGVDIDSQAVEVTKLNLLLKALEGESKESVDNVNKWFREPALPDLENNIKCGNSLVDFDIEEMLKDLPPEEREQEIHSIKPFNWNNEFPTTIKNGGFDAVIGNPPYVFGRDWNALNISEINKKYLSNNYKSSSYQLDMFSIFMEKASAICKLNGYAGQIVPNVWLTNMYSKGTRSFILSHAKNLILLLLPSDVFDGLTVDTLVYTLNKNDKPDNNFTVKRLENKIVSEIGQYDTTQYLGGEKPIPTIDKSKIALMTKLKNVSIELQSIADITRGVHPYRTGGYGETAYGKGPQTNRDVEERPYHSKVRVSGYRPFIYGRDLTRFGTPIQTEYVKYGPWLAEPRQPEYFVGERVYSRKILGDRLVVTVEKSDSIADQQVYITVSKDPNYKAAFLTGILGSKLISFFIKGYYGEGEDLFPQIKVGQLKSLPIRSINISDPADKARHDKMVSLVERMLKLHKDLQENKTPDAKTQIERTIEATDKEIDALVYELYGLTEEEIKIVEGA